ncbi:hypothetical protein LOTGIDRAFT_168339 [Lottia gigantea]|uniref:Uncharacterized protein n=1 Tax=Lottia gigantea TaxID=225164 RepID=V3ZQS4_LOTGI|nr:hypothetical protein LOTGIDRAFT_168339 [Lottia gigantea]ESO84850.1 hypothetical protein LOTGIDRAFT_168339 [Lottia gigantea]
MANRLQLLEMAFKDQVVARLSIEREVSNQSYVNLLLDKKLAAFHERLDNMNMKYRLLERRLDEISSRLYSDESLGFLVIVLIIIEVIVRVKPQVQLLQSKLADRKVEKKDEKSEKDSDKMKNGNGVNYSPKHGLTLKNELCVIVFKKDNNNIISTFIDVTLKNLEDVKLTVPSHYVIEKHEMLRQLPRAKLYLVVTELEEKSTFGFCRQTNSDMQISTIRFVKSLGAQVIVLVANDENSKKLTAHSLYNTSLRFVQSHDILQDLATNGRVFSMWRELSSHQMGHFRKTIRNVLGLKIPNR